MPRSDRGEDIRIRVQTKDDGTVKLWSEPHANLAIVLSLFSIVHALQPSSGKEMRPILSSPDMLVKPVGLTVDGRRC